MTPFLDLSALRDNPDLVRLNPELLAENCAKNAQIPSKYRNVRTEYAGREYASAKEASRAAALDLEKRAHEIIDWWPQVSFPLEKGIRYVADFVILLPDLSVRVEDVKSEGTRKISTYRIKRKLFKARYGREIQEI